MHAPIGLWYHFLCLGSMWSAFSRNSLLSDASNKQKKDYMDTSTQGHLGRVGEERCAHIRALVIVNQALMSRQHLEEQAENWLREAGTTPPGNGIDRSEWEVRIPGSLIRASDSLLMHPLLALLLFPTTAAIAQVCHTPPSQDSLTCSSHASRSTKFTRSVAPYMTFAADAKCANCFDSAVHAAAHQPDCHLT